MVEIPKREFWCYITRRKNNIDVDVTIANMDWCDSWDDMIHVNIDVTIVVAIVSKAKLCNLGGQCESLDFAS